MKNILISTIRKDTVPLIIQDHTPQPFAGIGIKSTRYATLSNGVFEEVHTTKPIEKFNRTVFDTKTKKIKSFENIDVLYNNYNFDPVVFALSVDPLAGKYPHMSPYATFENNPTYFNDPTGKDAKAKVEGNTITISATLYVVGAGATKDKAKEMQTQVMGYWGKNNYKYTDEKGNVYNMKFDVQVKTVNPAGNNPVDEGTNFVRLVDDPKRDFRSFVSDESKTAGWYGQWGNDKNATTYSHETGHFLGIDDLYYMVTKDKAENYKDVDKNELMGRYGSTKGKGEVTQKDIDTLGKFVLSNQKDGKAIIKAAGDPVRNSKRLEKQDK